MGLLGAIAKFLFAMGFTDLEMCYPPYVAEHVAGLPRALDDKFYGQPLAKRVILTEIEEHVYNNNPRKALVLSLHGPVGVGKSYVAGIIAEHLYHKDFKSRFVHRLVGSKDFAHWQNVHEHKWFLRNWVEQGVRTCERSLFIIEEVHEMPPGVLDALRRYVGYIAVHDGLDYRKAIFIFASNVGTAEINNYTVNHLRRGGTRETIQQNDMTELLSKVVFDREGGLHGCSEIRREMISALVAFLPLERHHVKLCAKDEARRRGFYRFSDAMAERVANDATYWELFSSYGCKGVEDSVSRILYENTEL